MKFITFILGILLIANCAHSATTSTTSSPDNIVGTWKGVYDNGGMDGHTPKLFIFIFRSNGESLTGEACDVTSRPNEWVQLRNLKREGNNISFTTTSSPTPEIGQMKTTFKYKGEIKGDEIKLTFKTEINGQIIGEPQSFTIKRER